MTTAYAKFCGVSQTQCEGLWVVCYTLFMVALKMFGTPQVRVAKRWETVALDKSSALLFYVATHPNGVSRGALATLLWSNTDDSRARANLRQLLTRVRRQIWSAALEIGEDFLFWRGECDFALSATRNLCA
jgi:DNA-binding SARP family transcriptional activator